MGLHDALYNLFLIDQQCRGLESRLDGAAQHVRAQQIKLDQLNTQLKTVSEEARRAAAAEANLENEAAAIDQRIGRLREQMNTAKTNKEYSAFLVEVNTLKADKSKIEEQALALMGEIEKFQAQVEDLKQKVADQEKIKAMADTELQERRAEVGDQLDDLKRQRAVAAAEVPDSALAIFERLADTLDGEAMAPVIQEDKRRMEYACGGCYMSIPVEKVNQLITLDDLVRCTSCSRILYLEKELKAAMGIKS